MPYADFAKSAKVLDMRRLGKQRVEVLQLLNSFYKLDYRGWKNHPVREMWRGYGNALVKYGQVICVEWLSRGYKDTCYDKITARTDITKPYILPPWFGREDIHQSHKSNLIRKMPNYYKAIWPEVADNLEYAWPVPLKGTAV